MTTSQAPTFGFLKGSWLGRRQTEILDPEKAPCLSLKSTKSSSSIRSNSLSSSSAGSDATIAELQNRNVELLEQSQINQTLYQDCLDKLLLKETRIEELTSSTLGLHETIEKLDEQLCIWKGKYAAILGDVSTEDCQSTEQVRPIDEKKDSNSDVHKLAKAYQEIEALKSKLKQVQSDKQNDRASNDSEISGIKAMLRDTNLENQHKTEALDAKTNELTAVQNQLDQTKENLKMAETANKELKSRVNAVEAKLVDKEQRNRGLLLQVDELALLKAQGEAAAQHRKKLISKLQDQHKTLTDLYAKESSQVLAEENGVSVTSVEVVESLNGQIQVQKETIQTLQKKLKMAAKCNRGLKAKRALFQSNLDKTDACINVVVAENECRIVDIS